MRIVTSRARVMWFTEDPWPPTLILVALAVSLLGSWYARRRAAPLVGAALLLVACVAVWIVERAIVTQREVIEQNVLAMTDACRAGDTKRTIAFISPQNDSLRRMVETAMGAVDVEDDLRVTDLKVEIRARETMAISRFRANATIRVGGFYDHHGKHPSRWELTWQKVGDDWKVIEIRRISLVGDRDLGLMERAE